MTPDFTPPLVLALDLGTSSVRALLFDRQARPLAGRLARRPVVLQTSPGGAATMNARQVLDSLWQCIDETLAQAGPLADQIAAVGGCSFASSLLGVDQEGQPVTPLYTYADTQPAADARALRARLDESAVHQRTGCIFHPSYLPARFAWLARTRPDLLRPEIRWMSLGEYLALKLFGRAAASYSLTSWTGLLDRSRLDWDAPLLDELPVQRSQLSPLVDVDTPFNGLRAPFAGRWPALRHVPWYPLAGDGAAANLGSGCISPDRIAVTIGTSSAVRAVLAGSPEHVPQGLWCYRLDRHASLLGGALSEGGNVYDWLRRTLRLPDGPELESALAELPSGEEEPAFLPLLAGERSPGWFAGARGIISGLSLATTPLDILKAGLEGVAYRLALVYQQLRPALPGEPAVIASGGALTRSSAWMQIVADVLGLPLVVSDVQEASARGAAMLALRSLEAVPDLSSFPVLTRQVYNPVPERHAQYQHAIQRQGEIYARFFGQPEG